MSKRLALIEIHTELLNLILLNGVIISSNEKIVQTQTWYKHCLFLCIVLPFKFRWMEPFLPSSMLGKVETSVNKDFSQVLDIPQQLQTTEGNLTGQISSLAESVRSLSAELSGSLAGMWADVRAMRGDISKVTFGVWRPGYFLHFYCSKNLDWYNIHIFPLNE